MSNEDKDPEEEHGIWYWLSLSDPANYFIAKALGGKAEKDADAAWAEYEKIGPVIVIICLIIFFVVMGVLALRAMAII